MARAGGEGGELYIEIATREETMSEGEMKGGGEVLCSIPKIG